MEQLILLDYLRGPLLLAGLCMTGSLQPFQGRKAVIMSMDSGARVLVRSVPTTCQLTLSKVVVYASISSSLEGNKTSLGCVKVRRVSTESLGLQSCMALGQSGLLPTLLELVADLSVVYLGC